jgi:predicted dienelactone hydrolase
LIPALLALAASGLASGDQAALGSAALAADSRVGHSVKRLDVPRTAGASRPVDVHVWYPAEQTRFPDTPKTFYTSTLKGVSLAPAPWLPLSWTVEAQIAREEVPIDSSGKAFPVIVFSHGNTNEPIDYAHTLELIAGEGFVVAAPAHVGNTQDDVRIDFVNREAARAGIQLVLRCRDGQPPPDCSRPNVPQSMRDRARDITAVLDALPSWYGDRVDVSRAGVMGHSRGTVTALTAAGGSDVWGIEAEPRTRAVMGLAIALQPITEAVNLTNVTVPALLLAGGLDRTSVPAISEFAFNRITSEEKAIVTIRNATHRTFDSTYCAQMQAAGAIAKENQNAILDSHTVTGIVRDPRGTSGVAMDYCSLASFTNPVDIRGLVASITQFDFINKTVPTTDLESEEVKHGVTELAVTFFGTVLKRTGNDGPHFTRFLAPKWLEKHEPMVACAMADTSETSDAILPPGQDVPCDD